MTFLMMLSVILLSILLILLSILSVIRHLICGNELNWPLNLNLIYETQWTWARSGLLISVLGKPVSFDWSNDIGAINVKMDGSVLEEKSSFKMLGLTFSSKLDWGSCIISIAKIGSKKIGALIRSMKFLSPEVALYLYKSTIRHVWNTIVTSGLVPLVATWNCWNCYMQLLLNPWLIIEMWPAYVFSIGINVVDVLQNWPYWFHFLFCKGSLLVILIDRIIFLSPFLDVTRMSMSTV